MPAITMRTLMKFLAAALFTLLLACCGSLQPPTVGHSLTTPGMARQAKTKLNQIENAYLYFVSEGTPGKKGSLGKANVLDRKVVKPRGAEGKWTEEWTVERRSGVAIYTIHFIPIAGSQSTLVRISTPPRLSS